jgi:hypothetical protein
MGRLGFSPAAMAAWRSTGWDAGRWPGSSRGASTGQCGAVGALGRDEKVLYRRVNRRPSGGGAWSSPALRKMRFECVRMKLDGW